MLFFHHMLPWPFWHGFPRTHEKQWWGGRVLVCRQECLQGTAQFWTALPFPSCFSDSSQLIKEDTLISMLHCTSGHGAWFLNSTVIIPCWICQLSCFPSAAVRKVGSGLECSKWESHHVLWAYKNVHIYMGLTLYICYILRASKHKVYYLFTNEHDDCQPSH